MAKTKRLKSSFKIQRRLMCELPGLGKPGAMDRRPYPPGQHGNTRRKFSDHSLQLIEKQKVLFHYGLREKQLRHFIKRAKKGSGSNWTQKTISLLESRLDNVLFRASFASSIAAAKQLCSHRKVLVNGKIVDIRSAILKPGDVVSLKDSCYQNQVFMHAQSVKRLELPLHLEVTEKDSKPAILVKDKPPGDANPFPFNENLFTEYYSKRG
ncbi:MAG: 30S ribosomal protein S4 [Bdellovibrionaceae bacterium]|nr:30S ribosomal protein S4 [Pseudobdellovibrionaceae bacterium]|tara:strand:+ start:24710 stop:25339 length:630 start_codon:yes stop_codon:yes gene_type:complete